MEYSNFKIHHLNGYIQSIYLVEYPDKLLLLDGGSRGDVEIIEKFITETLHRNISDLKLIIVTHLHPDHAGAAPYLREKYNTPIAAHPEINEWYNGPMGLAQYLLDTIFAKYVGKKKNKEIKRTWYKRFLKPDLKLVDKQLVPMFDDWEIVYTPGHTTHDISIYNKKEKIIYIGDLAIKMGDKFNLPFPVALKNVMSKSFDKVMSLDIDIILFAHGGQVKNNSNEAFKSAKSRLRNYPPKKFAKVQWITNLNGAIGKYQ